MFHINQNSMTNFQTSFMLLKHIFELLDFINPSSNQMFLFFISFFGNFTKLADCCIA